MNKEGPGTCTLHLDTRVDQGHGGCVWKGPQEQCSICDLGSLSFCIVNVGQTNNAQQNISLSLFVSFTQEETE